MPLPLPEHQRAEILEAIRVGGKSRAAIAREHGVSPWTVGKIAREHGIVDAFSREQTKNATAAVVADSKARRAVTSRRFLDKANDLLDQMDEPHIVFNIGGKDNVYTEHQMARPPTGDLRNLMTSAAIAFDKHLAAERHDVDTGAAGARSVLGALADALAVAADQIDGSADDGT